MDLHTALICLGVFAVSAVVVYLISVLGIKEKTYEEAIAEQRRKGEEMLLLQKKASDKAPKDKKHKKWGRKSKEKSDKGGGEDELHVGFKPEAEIIPEDKENDVGKKAPPSGGGVKGARKQSDEPKSILIVKKEKEKSPAPGKVDADDDQEGARAVKEPSPKNDVPRDGKQAAADKKEKTPPPPPPPKKDEGVLADARDSKKKEQGEDDRPKKPDLTDRKEEPTRKEEPVRKEEPAQKERSKERELKAVEERAKKEDAPLTGTTMSPGKKPKKNKLDDEGLNSARLANLIKSSVLSRQEIQSLIETLLNKQQAESGDAEWSKIGQKIDPISALRKQLQEKEEALGEERQRAVGVGNKLKEVRQELNAERSSRQQLERAGKERQQELQNLHAQLQRSSSDAAANQAKFQQLQAKSIEETNAVQALKDENGQLRQSLGQLESGSNSLQCENETLREDFGQIELQCQQLQELVRNFELEKTNVSSKYEQTVADLQSQLLNAEGEKSALKSDLQDSHVTCESLERDQESFQQKVAELESDLNTRCKANSELQEYAEGLNEQKAALEVQMVALQNQLQEINGRLMISDNELVALKEHNELLAAQISKVTEREEAEGQEGCGDTVTTDKTNGHIQLEDSGDQTQMLLSEHEHILHEKEKLLDQLTAELADKEHHVQELGNEVNNFKEEITRLSTEADKQKEKNNETILDIRTTEQKAAQDVLERIFPSIRIEKMDHSDWVSQFEGQALHLLSEALSATNDSGKAEELRERLEASEDAYGKLQAQVLHYKTSLVETEGILKKIQGSVEEEELKWREKLEAKDQQLEKLLDVKKSYEASLDQVRAAEEAVVEMQDKLRELKDKLQSEENERRSLEVQRLESQKVASSLNDQLRQAEEQLQQWKMEREGFAESAKEVDALREELETVRRSYEQLQSQHAELEGQLKVGVEAVRLEQERVKHLQAKYEAPKSENTIIAATNGPPPTDCDASNLESSCCGGVDANQWPNSSLSAASRPATSFSYTPQQPSPAHSTTTIIAAATTGSTSKKPKNKKRAASVKK